jgi:serine/threonine-protein kinase
MQRPPPPPADCPPGAAEGHARLGIEVGDRHDIFIAPFDWNKPNVTREVLLSEGNVTADIMGDWGNLPSRSPLYGELFFGGGRVYGRFTQARLPNGALVPVCMEMVRMTSFRERGIAIEPGSTPKKARVENALMVQVVNRFE